MRFADRPEVERQVHVDAPPDAVWAVCTDLSRFGEWSPENRGGDWLDGTGPALNARFRGTQHHPAVGEWHTVSVVTDYDPPRRFAWAVGDPDHPGAVWSFTLEPQDGGTRLCQHVQMGPGPSGTTAAIERMPDKEERIVGRRLHEYEAGLDAVLAGIKAAVEGRARPGPAAAPPTRP